MRPDEAAKEHISQPPSSPYCVCHFHEKERFRALFARKRRRLFSFRSNGWFAALAIEKRVALLEQLGEGVLPVVVPDVQYIIEGHH